MALNETVRGAIHGQSLPFPLDKKSTISNNSKLLGLVFDLPNGLQAVLVKAVAAKTSPGKLCFKWSDQDAGVVAITSSTVDKAVGVTHPNLEDLAADDYFFLLRPGAGGTGRITCVDSGSGVTAGDFVQPTAAGEVVTDAAYEYGVSLGQAEATVSADGDVNVLLTSGLFGAQA